GTVTSPKRARALSRSTLSGSASSAGAVLRASSEDEEPPRAIREDSESRRRVAPLGQDRVAQLGLAHDRAQGTALVPRHVAAWSRGRISATGGACPRSSLGLGAPLEEHVDRLERLVAELPPARDGIRAVVRDEEVALDQRAQRVIVALGGGAAESSTTPAG